jgi:ABC-type uncharacterized transport system auxiliary subunit
MKKLTVFATILVLTAACSGNPVPEDHFYRLPGPAAATGAAGLVAGTVFVEQLLADGLYRERAIVRADRGSPTQLSQYHYEYWMDSPTRMVRDHLADYLRGGGAASVVSTSPDVPAEVSIFGRIQQLEIVEGSGNDEVAVAIEFRVDREGRDTPVLIRAYEERAQAGDDSVNGAVAAFGDALSRIYARLVEDIRAGT